MCLTIERARLNNTRIYSAEVQRDDGKVYQVIGYQNSVESQPGPNAMLLPFPAEGKVGPENLVNGEKFKDILAAYGQAIERLKPVTKSARRSRGFDEDALLGGVAGHVVFESGSYTIALADKAVHLAAALKEIPEARRPVIPARFIVALGKLYPDWPIALCCFEGDIVSPEPLFWWFRSRFPEVLFAPAIDAHDGNPPNLEAQVQRDHMIAYASYASSRPVDEALQSTITYQVPAEHRWLFNARVCGGQVRSYTQNGDFVTSVNYVRNPKKPAWMDLQVSPPPQDRPTAWDHLLKDNVTAP